MDVYLKCRLFEPEDVRALAKLFEFSLIGEPIKTKVASLTKDDFSEELIWKVDKASIAIVSENKQRCVFSAKDNSFPLGKLEPKRAIIFGQAYDIELMTIGLNCCHQVESA